MQELDINASFNENIKK
uniref:Uncharacterized protein n=1 Tax=Rhizophora mucronata TaxID=61149 RepID=A0A2P2IWE0_RHIMU